jgi:hypothetical protein
MARKVYDLCVKTGSYRDKSGQEKGRYQTVGAVMEGDDGRQFAMLEAWFNPSGIDRQQGRGSIILSMFEPKTKQDGGDVPF